MKKIAFGLIIICTVALSCKKDHKGEIKPDETAQKVTFSVGFSKTLTNFGAAHLKLNTTSADTSLTNHINILYFMVFDSAGNNLHTILQRTIDTVFGKSDTVFGKFTDNLHPGKYTVIVAGGQTLDLAIGSNNSLSGSVLDKSYIYYETLNNVSKQYVIGNFAQDAFYKKISLVVTNVNSTQNISLDRITSKLQVNINDPIPPGAGYIATTINGIANVFYVNTGTAGVIGNGQISNTYSATLTGATAGITNYQMSLLFLYYNPCSVNIICATSQPQDLTTFNGTVFGSTGVSNVTAQPNKITLLSGNLFGGTGGGGIQVSADTSWNTPVTQGF